jgi:hypothetical protein
LVIRMSLPLSQRDHILWLPLYLLFVISRFLESICPSLPQSDSINRLPLYRLKNVWKPNRPGFIFLPA